MREKAIEQGIIRAVRRSGGLALKFVSPNLNGVPDRLLLFPGGRAAFCEVKAPGQKPRPLQVHRMEQLRKLGFRVYVVDSAETIETMLEEIKNLQPHDMKAIVQAAGSPGGPYFGTPKDSSMDLVPATSVESICFARMGCQ